jgi:hypothetical protein
LYSLRIHGSFCGCSETLKAAREPRRMGGAS